MKREEAIENTACACNRVNYDPIKIGKTFKERWRCDDCGCEFIKKSIYQTNARMVEEVVGKLKERIAELEPFNNEQVYKRSDEMLQDINRGHCAGLREALTLLTEEK